MASTSATSAAWIAVSSGTLRRPSASLAHSTLERFPNMGAAVMRAISAGWAWKALSATTPTKPPSTRPKATGRPTWACISRR